MTTFQNLTLSLLVAILRMIARNSDRESMRSQDDDLIRCTEAAIDASDKADQARIQELEGLGVEIQIDGKD